MQKRSRSLLTLFAFVLLVIYIAAGEPGPKVKQNIVFTTALLVVAVSTLAFTAQAVVRFLRRHRRYRNGALSLADTEGMTPVQLLARLTDGSHQWFVDTSDTPIADAGLDGDAIRIWWAGANESWPIDFHPVLIDGTMDGLIVIWENIWEQVKIGERYEYVEVPSPTGLLLRDDFQLKLVMDTYGR